MTNNNSLKLKKHQMEDLKQVYVLIRTSNEYDEFAASLDKANWKTSGGNTYKSKKSTSCQNTICYHNIFYGTNTSDLSSLRNVAKILTLDEFWEYMKVLQNDLDPDTEKEKTYDTNNALVKIFIGGNDSSTLQNIINDFITENNVNVLDLKINLSTYRAYLLYTKK